MDLIKLKRDDLHKSLFRDVMFLMFSEPGGMPGGNILFITRDAKLYGFNYLTDDIELSDILPLFPTLGECRFGMFGKGTVVPAGWHYRYLGIGSHLMIEESVYPEFEENLIDFRSEFDILANWTRIARLVLTYE